MSDLGSKDFSVVWLSKVVLNKHFELASTQKFAFVLDLVTRSIVIIGIKRNFFDR